MNVYPDSVGAYIPEDIYWNDLGTLPKYFQAHNDILLDNLIKLSHYRGLPETCDSPEKPGKEFDCKGFNVFGKGVTTGQGAYLENCIILDNSVIAPGAFHCNQVIHPAFVVHRDELEIRSLRIMKELTDSTVCSLQEQGSARGFYRIIGKNRTQILMVSDADDPDFERFINYGRYFGGNDKQLPEIYAAVPDEFSVLIEDLGNNTLHRYIKSGCNDLEVEKIYCRVIDALLEFQLVQLDGVPELRVFRQDYLRWETAYFAENLLGGYCNIPTSVISNLDVEFDLLSQLVFDHGQVLIHRDFQSQNIMIDPNGKIRFVDYQGMRMGSPGYDIMSLVLDPYAELPPGIRKRLIKYYQKSTNISEQIVNAAGLQRIMQALGAYGCLGLVKGKRQYLRYIPFAFSMLKELLRNPPLPMPRLTKLTDEISF
jgi:aminoglycoside/choline kinase family phosphotransferase